jgi:hypothetical protein
MLEKNMQIKEPKKNKRKNRNHAEIRKNSKKELIET